MEQDIRPVTWVKNRTRELLEQINETRRPVIVTQDGKPRAVVQDPRSYERTQVALEILQKVLRSEQDIEQGRVMTQEEAFAQMRRHIRRVGKRKSA